MKGWWGGVASPREEMDCVGDVVIIDDLVSLFGDVEASQHHHPEQDDAVVGVSWPLHSGRPIGNIKYTLAATPLQRIRLKLHGWILYLMHVFHVVYVIIVLLLPPR